MKHTQGKWTIVNPSQIINGFETMGIDSYGDKNKSIIVYREREPREDTTPEEELANAKLIACSPELLQALTDLCREMKPYILKLGVRKGFSEMVALAEAESVIKKATE